ncbi:MAG: TonB-dependent receptor [Fidelibacterota bacterium]
MHYSLFFKTILFHFVLTISFASTIISGVVIDKSTKQPIDQVNIVTSELKGTSSDSNGEFRLIVDKPGASITFTHIGYEPVEVRVQKDASVTIEMVRKRIDLPDITVSANRSVEGVTPVSFSIATPKEISMKYYSEDAPMILSSEPGIHAYSESGNGTGYSYLSIRGFDQSRISVMLDNVSLNDNESHQVYWVDHGDILSDASFVEVQRGIGNSLYGAASFGGSVNVVTEISRPVEQYSFSYGIGSYQTNKFRVQYFSNGLDDGKIHFTTRFTLLQSDGYRQDSQSKQHSFFGGIEYKTNDVVHQFRALIGKELSRLQWDGITREMVDDPQLRTGKMDWTTPFTDDFIQQVYSLNSFFPINEKLIFRNTAYLVTGSGFYEVEKFDVDYYSYNLDINDQLSDESELGMTTDLLRRKWITNHYFGITPVITSEWRDFRFDVGAEIREYSGHHFGEVSEFSDQTLIASIPGKYRYYDFTGKKSSETLFSQVVWNFNSRTNITGDLQFQHHDWRLIQEPMGHFTGVDISAKWNFINPRIGFTFKLDPLTTLFGNYGTAQKEPSDDQIISADDVWDAPKAVQPEKVYDLEIGMHRQEQNHFIKLNYYHMTYQNEILSDIYDFEETEFDIITADETVHQGIEYEMGITPNNSLELNMNGTFSTARYVSGDHQNNQLPNVPEEMINLSVTYKLFSSSGLSYSSKYVGRQFIDSNNTRSLSIDPYFISNMGFWIKGKNWKFQFRVNNLFDVLYETYGYEYWGGYYWPGATRNMYLEIKYYF